MLSVRLITVGTLKEAYWRDAIAEYKKRLGAFCRVEEVNLKEARVPEGASQAQIQAALEQEGEAMLAYLSPRAYKIALCVEGKMMSSEALASHLDEISARASEVCLVIGSSWGLSERVKRACHVRLSLSKMTFPHQLMRVILAEALYRAMTILAGKKYHK